MKNIIFEILLIIALAMGVYACWPDVRQLRQVNIPLYPIKAQQQELKDRGHYIKVDGKFGPNTDMALSIEIAKAGE